MKDDPSLVPSDPITELRERLAEIIAKKPPQGLTLELSGELGEIVAERIAGVAPEQRTAVAQLTIIEILLTTPHADVVNRGVGARDEVPLTGLLRRHVALELARLWIPEREWKETERQRELKHIEDEYFLAKWSRKTKSWTKPRGPNAPAFDPKAFKKTAPEVMADAVGKDPATWLRWLRRERRARKKPQP